MAIINSDLTVKGIRQRGLYEGKTQSVSGRFRLKVGQSITTADTLRAVPLGENVRPTKITLTLKKVSGTPAITGGAVNVGVAPQTPGVNLKRADGTEFPPLTASAALYGAADFDAGVATKIELVASQLPSANTKWGPFWLTLTPTETSTVSGGEFDVNVTVEYQGEKEEAAAVYDSFLVNGGKYQN